MLPSCHHDSGMHEVYLSRQCFEYFTRIMMVLWFPKNLFSETYGRCQ